MAGGFTMRWVVYDNKLPKVIAGMEPMAAAIVAKAAHDIEARAKLNAPIITGTLRNSIQASQIGPAAWRVVVGAEYGIYVEWGTRFMAAKPYLRPAINAVEPSFLAAMRKVCTP